MKRVVFCVSEQNMQVYYDAMCEFFPVAKMNAPSAKTLVTAGVSSGGSTGSVP